MPSAAVLPRASLDRHAICDGIPFSFRRAASSPDEVIGADDVDLAVVLTRHDSHAALVREALRRGKPCFVEKPLATRREDLVAVVDAADASPAPWVCVGFNRRFAPATAALRKALGDPRRG